MDLDPGTLPVIMLVAGFLFLCIAIPVLVIRSQRRSSQADLVELAPLLARLAVIAGAPSPHPVRLYAVHGSSVSTSECRPMAFPTRDDALEVEELARRLRAFSYRWGPTLKGGILVRFTRWWNHQRAVASITAFRRSHRTSNRGYRP